MPMQVPFVVLFGPRIYLPLFIFVFVHFLHHLIMMVPSSLPVSTWFTGADPEFGKGWYTLLNS